MKRSSSLLRRLLRSRRAVSAVEFGLIAPVMTTMGLGAIELANMAMTYTRVTQVAIQMADNTSRAKQASGPSGGIMRDYDVNDAYAQIDVLYPGLKIYNNGRIILSSLEQNSSGGQWIHWQRCKGTFTTGVSKYGVQGTGITGTAFTGMGPTGNVVTADARSAIMFVEVYYKYQPIFFNLGGSAGPTIYRAAAMFVRDDRDLTNINNTNTPVTANTC